MATTKEAWLERIRNHKPQRRTISHKEYYKLFKLAKFTCPRHRKGYRMLFCDGHDCPTNMKTHDTYEQECRRARRFQALIMMVQTGWLHVATA